MLNILLSELTEIDLILPGSRVNGTDINDTSSGLLLLVKLVSLLDLLTSARIIIMPSIVLVLPDLPKEERE